MIRTQELAAARRVDGAEQYFTRARDFGFSKSVDETLAVWDEVLKWPWLSNLKTLFLSGVSVTGSPYLSRLTTFPGYRAAFEERVGRVDWETEYITPVDGDTCWHGLTWEKRPGSAAG